MSNNDIPTITKHRTQIRALTSLILRRQDLETETEVLASLPRSSTDPSSTCLKNTAQRSKGRDMEKGRRGIGAKLHAMKLKGQIGEVEIELFFLRMGMG